MKITEMVARSACAVTGSNDLEVLHLVRNFPVFMGCSKSDVDKDLTADMQWSISLSSGLIQLSSLVPLQVLYSDTHGSGVVGRLWDMHHKAFANYINRSAPSSVLEIGGGHGILSKEYKSYNDIPWTIVEPNPSPVVGCDARYIKAYFDGNIKVERSFDAVVHSHVIEHVYQTDQFMANLSEIMTEGKSLVFSLPNMQRMLEKKYTNCINFEHTVFLTEPYIDYLLKKHGFRLIDKTYFLEDHSIFYTAIRDSKVTPIQLPPMLFETNRRIYQEYVDYHRALIDDLNQKIRKTNGPVYLFGAHIFSQYLIANGLAIESIQFVLDNDLAKQGSRLYGTSLSVCSPKVLRHIECPSVILKAGAYNNEIREDILSNINDTTRFLE